MSLFFLYFQLKNIGYTIGLVVFAVPAEVYKKRKPTLKRVGRC
jgi:hypothetical protein